MMAEEVDPASRTTSADRPPPALGETDVPAPPHGERHGQPRRSLGRPASDEATEELPKTKQAWYKRPLLLCAAVGLLIIIALLVIPYYNYAVSHEWTDDAFVEGHIIQVSSRVAGHVAAVYVTDNQEVNQGDLLAALDSPDFAARLAQARAVWRAASAKLRAAEIAVEVAQVTADAGVQEAGAGLELALSAVNTAEAQVATARSRLEQARAQVETAQANAAQAQAQVVAAEANARRAEADVRRFQELSRRDQISRQDLDHASADARAAAADLEAARKKAVATEAQVSEARAAQQTAAETLRQIESQVAEARARVGEAQGRLAATRAAPQQVAVSQAQAELARAEVEQAQAAARQAELDLSYTTLHAPAAGRVTRKSVEAGAYVQVGQALMMIVPHDLWVVANFKETQLTYMRPRQPVEISVDAYPDLVFKGHVDSLQMGSGSRFSLLPPENATGNFIKVVQRIPVKIVIDDPVDPAHLLGPGMSVVPVVKVK